MSPPKVLRPVPCRVNAVSGVVPPTTPKEMAPLPLLIVKPYAPFTAAKLILPLELEVKVRDAPESVSAPEYVCAPVVVTLAPNEVVPPIVKLETPEIFAERTASFVIAKVYPAPASALFRVNAFGIFTVVLAPNATLLALVITKSLNLVTPPIAPAKVMTPEEPAFKVNDSLSAAVPLMVEPNVIFPVPLTSVVSAVSVTAPT